ncbi:MAG: hypothetical protein COA79_04700 [Planctomycetota bacterium]|nr:MAG: hypothetical protein COA79_04700 [Planctomycetota bacterium]
MIYSFTILAMASKLMTLLALIIILAFCLNIIIKHKFYGEFLFPPLVFLILSILTWKLSHNLNARLYLKITKASQKIIVKTQTWTKETGAPPENLNVLMPIHLKKIPKQPYPFYGDFIYIVIKNKPTLYVSIPSPPFKNKYFVFSFNRKTEYEIIDTYLGWHLTDQEPK